MRQRLLDATGVAFRDAGHDAAQLMAAVSSRAKPVHTTLERCHQRESACPGTSHKWECTNLMWSGLVAALVCPFISLASSSWSCCSNS